MSTRITRIGIIQTAPLPGDFPNNLRAIVNAYRECLEHDADIVIAPAAAVCGLEPGNLALRSSFLEQTQDCLHTLSRELGSAPLLLAAYTRSINDEDLYAGIVAEGEEDDEPWLEKETSVLLTPYLLEHDCVTELAPNESFSIGGQSFYIDLSDAELLPDEDCDFVVRLPLTPWHTTADRDDAEQRSWEAGMSRATVICSRAVGTAGGNIYGGGSGVYSAGGRTLLRLPFFETGAAVVNPENPKPVLALPEPAELLCSAIERGIRDTVRNNCFNGVCIPLDHPNSALLGALCVQALGAARVCGISFTGDTGLADKLGITAFNAQADNLQAAAAGVLGEEQQAPLLERLRTAVSLTYAESRGMLLCSPLSRREIMLGEFSTYGLAGGHLAPLGNLYHIDLFLAAERLREQHPDLFGALSAPADGMADRIIHELHDRNTPAGELLNPDTNYLFKENEVRHIQRRLVASAMKRTQLPIILQAAPACEQMHFPLAHRLND